MTLGYIAKPFNLFIILKNLFFFFKQKTAYEMLRSLVGSEMCIRDSPAHRLPQGRAVRFLRDEVAAWLCLLYTSDAADDLTRVDLGGRRIITKKKNIGKIAQSIADDMLTTKVMASNKKVIFAPAMNKNMISNPLYQQNVEKLTALGYEFIDSEYGQLACGELGAVSYTHLTLPTILRV